MISENGSDLSGGEKKRICLGRVLIRITDVLILNEPWTDLDAAAAERIEDLLLGIEGKLLIVVSHQFTEDKIRFFDIRQSFLIQLFYKKRDSSFNAFSSIIRVIIRISDV